MLARFLLGVWLVLVGVSWLNWIDVNLRLLGLLAFVDGLLWLYEITWPAIEKRP